MRFLVPFSLDAGRALCFAFGLFACSTGPQGDHGPVIGEQPAGSIVLGLKPVSGLSIDSVHYAVAQGTPQRLLRAGTLPTLGSGDSLGVGLELAPGSNYWLSLSGTSVEAGTLVSCTGLAGPFAIVPGITPFIEMDFACVDNTSGSLSPGLAVGTEACPDISLNQVTVLPAIAQVSSTIELVVDAQDLRGRALSFSWSLENPSLGSLQDRAYSHARLTCVAPADAAFVTVSASNGECSKSAAAQFSCVAR